MQPSSSSTKTGKSMNKHQSCPARQQDANIHSKKYFTMASSNKPPRVVPLRPRQSLLKERFPVHFNAFRPQAYSDTTTTRGASSHKYVPVLVLR